MAHPRWGARRIAFELAAAGVASPPSRATVHRVVVRNGLVRPQEQQHRRKYKRWQREAPMHLWQLDLVGGIYLADGRECKMLTGIDDHSRFVVAAVVSGGTVRAGRGRRVPQGDAGIRRTVRSVDRQRKTVHGPVHQAASRRSALRAGLPGERDHHRELLEASGPFADLPTAQAAISAWVHTYNHHRPHQSLNMAAPASLFRPNAAPEQLTVATQMPPVSEVAADPVPAVSVAPGPVPGLVLGPTVGAVEFDTVIAASGLLAVIPSVQRISMGAERAGQRAHV
jgi:transposase InsO family protein